MLNAGYDFRRNNAGLLVNPEQASAGWKNLGKGLQVAAGVMSWKDAKDRAARMNKAQEDYYDALTSYLNNKDVDVKSQQDAIEDEELYSQLEDLPEDEINNETKAAYEASNASQTGGSDADYAYRMALARRNQYADILDSILKKYGYGGK